MRVQTTRQKKVRAGNRVRFQAELRKGQHVAFCEIFSSVGGSQPSPHVPMAKIGLLKKDRPIMVNSTTIRLSEASPSKEIELIADEDCKFCIFQDVDSKDSVLAKTRILRDGSIWDRIASAFGRLR